ncbi:MAG: sugar ABC transporter permease [Clostridia bacterium]|nr:sugar ABC transporter permease [Clostridia bacterium]
MKNVNTSVKTQTRFSSWRKMVKVDFKRNKSLYVLLLPVLAFYFIFHYMPMYGALMAFTEYTPTLGIFGSQWVGFRHFTDFFSSPSFGAVLGNTLKISLSTLVFNFPAPIILALLLNELRSQKFSKAIQNAAYLPHFISLVVVCGLVKTFTKDSGIITQLLTLFGMPEVSLLNYPEYFTPVYVGATVWQETGWNSIIYLAALTGVDAALYEASQIDGANRWKQTWHITLPSILPTIVTMLILNIGSILNVGYEKILLLYNDATLEVADVISTFVYRKGLLEQSWGFSAAVNIFNSVINLILLLSANTISKKLNDTSLW